jgi:hypothetical protein
MRLISISEVTAHWAYSEILQSHCSACYDNVPGVGGLRERRGKAVRFDDLSAEERNVLSAGWHAVRGFFIPYLQGVDGYRVERWRKGQLLAVRVPRPIAPNHPLLVDFIFTHCDDMNDARNADKEIGFNGCFDDPLTLGLYGSEYVLGDGFHRTKYFLVWAADQETLPVYVPVIAK